MRIVAITTIALLMISTAIAEESKYVLNFDLETKSPDGSAGYSIQLQGIRLVPDTPFHGKDLGKFEYFLTVSDVKDGKARLTIEFYEYESRKKVSNVVSEIVAEVEITMGTPVVFDGMSETFGVDLAFSIVEE